MDVSLEHLQPIARNGDESQLLNYLDFVSESKIICLNKDKREEITSFVNSLLCSKESSKEGLFILARFINQCPKEILNTNILSWIQQAVKNLVNPENGSLSPIAFGVLGSLIELSSNFPEARKQIALTVIPKVLDHLVRESKGRAEDIVILQCLEEILKIYGKSCVFHKGAVSKVIFAHLSSSPSCIFIGGKCYLALATCGGPGANGENYITAWHNQQKFLLNSLHNLLDHLFQNITEVNDIHKKFRFEDNQPIIPLITEKSIVKRKQCLAKQFGGLAEFFKILLLGLFPVKKKILPESILGLVWRGLSINIHTLSVGQQSIDKSSLMTVIHKINLACLEILDALIVSCSMNLISYSQLICKILSQALKWTEVENWDFGVTKPNCSLRAKIYDCLRKWLTVSRACSGVDKCLDDHVKAIISDINHDSPTVSLKVPTGKGKRKLKDMKGSSTIKPSIEYLVDPEMNAESCEAALKYSAALFNSLSTLMSPGHHHDMQVAVVSKLILVQHLKFSVPYTNPRVRLALYEALLSLCQNSHHVFPPPVSSAKAIFSAGIRDTSVEVSNFCMTSLRSIEKILRPICPTLDFPLADEAVARMNISSGLDENCLLNDSKRQKMTKRKRNSQQVTSTPVSTNHTRSRLITPGIDTPLTIGNIQNLSDFEKGANFSLDKDLSVVTDLSEMPFVHQTVGEIGITTKDLLKNGVPINEDVGSENSQDSQLEECQQFNPEDSLKNGVPITEYLHSENSEDSQLEECQQNGNPEQRALKPSYSSLSPKIVTLLEHEKVMHAEDEPEVTENVESDDEMVNSFVDEVN